MKTSFCRLNEIVNDSCDVSLGHLKRNRILVVESQDAGRNRRPSAFVDIDHFSSQPWPLRGAFAAGMRQLHSRYGSLALGKGSDRPKGGNVRLAPAAD